MRNALATPWMIAARNAVRHNSFARAVYRRWMASRDYEENFRAKLLDSLDADSVVWDVGANVGLYTREFLERGVRHVVAFEPSPDAIAALRERHGTDRSRVTLVQAALSDRSGTIDFAATGASPTNRIAVGPSSHSGGVIKVAAMRADQARERLGLPMPNVVKIDVEGFELEVIEGFGDLLERAELRVLFTEVHFSLLHERGLDHAPAEIETLLGSHGFKVEWLDLSHFCALRQR